MPSSYIIDPAGGSLCGNKVSPIESPANPSAFKTLLTDPPDSHSSFVERLSDGRDSNRIITQHEVDLLQSVIDEGPSSWEVIKDDGRVSVHRYKNRSLFKGCLFGQLQVHLPNAPKELVAHSLCGVTEGCERSKWDHQVFDFKIFPAVGGNEVVYYKMAAPPFSARDFVCFQVLCRRKDGSGILAYMRSGIDALAPVSKDKVRARAYCIATEIRDDPAGGTRFKSTTVLDPAIPFIPAWIINIFVPAEFAKWADNLEKHCASLSKAGVLPASVPCAAAFLPEPCPPPVLAEVTPAPAVTISAACEGSLHKESDTSAAALSSAAAPGPATADPTVAVAAKASAEEAANAAPSTNTTAIAKSALPSLSVLPATADFASGSSTVPDAACTSSSVFADDVAPKTGWLCCAST